MSGKDDTVDTSSKIVSTMVKKKNSDILMPGENDVRKVSECSTSTVNQGEMNATGEGYEHSSESLEKEMDLRWDDEDDCVELIKHACGEPTCEPDKTQASPETGIIEVEKKGTSMNSSQSDLSIEDSHLEHGVNKPNVMLHIPGMLPNMDREMDQLNLHLSSDDNEFNIDKDLADSISKIESVIVESMATLDEDIIKETSNDKLHYSSDCEELNEPESDEKVVQSLDCKDESNGGTEIQEKLELSSEIEEDLLADENSEMVVKSLTDPIASIEEHLSSDDNEFNIDKDLADSISKIESVIVESMATLDEDIIKETSNDKLHYSSDCEELNEPESDEKLVQSLDCEDESNGGTEIHEKLELSSEIEEDLLADENSEMVVKSLTDPIASIEEHLSSDDNEFNIDKDLADSISKIESVIVESMATLDEDIIKETSNDKLHYSSDCEELNEPESDEKLVQSLDCEDESNGGTEIHEKLELSSEIEEDLLADENSEMVVKSLTDPIASIEEHLSSDDNEFNIDKDLADSIAKIESGIVESMATLDEDIIKETANDKLQYSSECEELNEPESDEKLVQSLDCEDESNGGTEIQEKLELSSEIEEDLLADDNSELVVKSLTDTIASIEELDQTETSKDRESSITMSQALTEETVSKESIENEVKLFAETMSTIDEERPLKVILDVLKPGLPASVQSETSGIASDEESDEPAEHQATPSEQRAKVMNLKVSTLISNIEEEMQLLDSGDEMDESSKVPDENVSQPTEIDIRKEPPIVKGKIQKPNVKKIKPTTQSVKKVVQDEKSAVIETGSDKVLDSELRLKETEISTATEPEPVHTELDENELRLKEQNELELAVKAIEQNYEVSEPTPAVTIVNTAFEPSEISIADEDPSTALMIDDDDDSIEEVQLNTAENTVHESQISVIQDSDDEMLVSDTEDVAVNDIENDTTQSSSLTLPENREEQSIQPKSGNMEIKETDFPTSHSKDKCDQEESLSVKQKSTLNETIPTMSEKGMKMTTSEEIDEMKPDVLVDGTTTTEEIVATKKTSEEKPTNDSRAENTAEKIKGKQIIDISQASDEDDMQVSSSNLLDVGDPNIEPAVALEKGTETTVKHKVREVTEKTKVTEIIGTNENKENMEKTKGTETIETGNTDKQKGPESIDKHIVTKITEIIEDTIITVKKKDSETTEIYKDTHITEYIKETVTTEKNQDTVITDINKETGTKEKYKDLELTEMNIDTDITENKNTEVSEKIDDAENRELPEKLDQEPVEMEPQPSTSLEMNKDSSNDVPDSDALGLLAESTRVMCDDDDQDDDEDDEDFYHDDESNLMTAEHSEDSNQNSDNAQDMPEDKEAHVTESTDVSVAGDRFSEEFDTPEHRENEFQFTISNVTNDVSSIDDSANQSEASTVESIQKIDSEIKQQSVESSCEAVTNDVTGVTVKGTDAVKEHTSAGDADISTKVSKPAPKAEEVEPASRSKKLSRCTVQPVLNFVELEESSEDEVQVVAKPVVVDSETESPQPEPEKEHPEAAPAPPEVSETDTDMQMEVLDEEYLKLNDTSLDEAAIDVDESTTATVEPTTELNIEPTDEPEPTVETTKLKTKTTVGLEVFNLDSDDEDSAAPVTSEATAPPVEPEQTKGGLKCINSGCKSKADARVYPADAAAVAFYNGDKGKRMLICEDCLQPVLAKNSELIEGIRSFMPLLELDMNLVSVDLVEISDSESEGEAEGQEVVKETLGEKGAKFIEENLADILNDTWVKFQMDSRLSDTESVLQMELKRLEAESNEIQSLLSDCQATTDRMRSELYASFPHDIKHVPPLVIYDTPEQQYCYIQAPLPESDAEAPPALPTRTSKRKLEAAALAESAAKRPAIPMGYTPLEQDNQKFEAEKIDDDNPDVSVVNIIASEVAPPGLPANGELIRPPVQVGLEIYAMRHAFGSWQRGIILEVLPKGSQSPFTMCKVKFDSKQMKNPIKTLPARCMAFAEPASVRMTIGTRVIADFKDDKDAKPATESKRESFFSGIVAEVPNPVNKYRYLIFFDDGYAQYASHTDTRLVCESSTFVWDEVHPFSRNFVREYLLAYPERPMVRLHAFQSLKTEWNGKWWTSRVVQVDASLAQVYFPSNNRYEWIYRGSTRLAPLYLELQAAERHRSRPMPRAQAHARANMPVVEYTRFDENSPKTAEGDKPSQEQRQEAEVTRQRAVAKKSTSAAPMPIQPPPRPPPGQNLDNITSRVVYYTPKNAVKPHKMVPHTCGPKCKRTDVLALKDLRTYNPLAKPLLSGWERQVVRYKGHKGVMYRAPCGRRVRGMRELHRYLRATRSDLPVDLFDFSPSTHCLAEFVLNKCLIMKKDLSQGKENVPIPCVNYYDETLPEFCSYNTERTPTAGVPLNIDPEFLCGCDCEDDCEDKSKCACWKLTLEGARTIGLKGNNVGYVYKRLPEPLPSGIYECNSRCKCKHTCLNRVAQHPLQLKLQIFKTLNRGWGIRALNDVPKGSFLCVYAGNLLTDATANLDGLNEGDEYLAELDYIEVVEQMKEGYEEDIPKELKKIGAKPSSKSDEESEEETQSSEEEAPKTSKNELEDQDFQPHMAFRVSEFSKRLRRRTSNKGEKGSDEGKGDGEGEKEKKKEMEQAKKAGRGDDDCITISDDDDEVRVPSSFAAAAGMGSSAFVSKYRSVRALFGEDEACYIMDAKVQGNIGRYLNHSCSPNVFVQNVFVDTHDPRFPWVAFFALSHIRAGAELTWNYNYDVGSVPGKALYCYCGAANCRGRLL